MTPSIADLNPEDTTTDYYLEWKPYAEKLIRKRRVGWGSLPSYL